MSDARRGADRAKANEPLERAAWQVLAVVAATLLIGAWHWDNDGPWFQ